MEDSTLTSQILEESCPGNNEMQPSSHTVQTYELQAVSQPHSHTFSGTSTQTASYLVHSSEGPIFIPDSMVMSQPTLVLSEHPTVSHLGVGFICDGSCEIEESFKREPLGEMRQQHMEVFSRVHATIALEYLSCLSMQVEDVLKKLQKEMKLNVGFSDEEKAYVVQGSFSDVVRCKQTLESLLHSTIGEDSSSPVQCMSHKSVMCDLPRSPECTDKDYSEPVTTFVHPEKILPTARVMRRCSTVGRKRLRSTEKFLRVHAGDQEQEMRLSRKKSSTCEETRENKENELYVNVTIASKRSFVSPSGDTNVTPARKIKRKVSGEASDRKTRKNYEELAPFKFFCTKCSFKTKRESHFHKHMKLHEKLSTVFRCDRCNFTTLRMGHLRRHYLLHSTTTHKCDECNYETDDGKFLVRHKRIRHSGKDAKDADVKVFACNECSYETTKLSYFQRHLRVHAPDGPSSDSRSYQCTMCAYHTNRKEHYYRHVNNVHVNKRPYLCDFCGKAFKRTDALKQHRITHAEIDPKATVFHCKECGKGCRSQAQLIEHTSVHSNIRSFLCEICGASFKTRSVQRKHVVTIHKNPRSHACSECMKRFNTRYALRRHMKKHGEEDEARKVAKDAEEESREEDRACSGNTFLVQNNEGLTDSILHAVKVSHSTIVKSKDDVDKSSELLSLKNKKSQSGKSRPKAKKLDETISLSATTSVAPHLLQEDGVTLKLSEEQLEQDSARSVAIQTSETTTALLYLTDNLS